MAWRLLGVGRNESGDESEREPGDAAKMEMVPHALTIMGSAGWGKVRDCCAPGEVVGRESPTSAVFSFRKR